MIYLKNIIKKYGKKVTLHIDKLVIGDDEKLGIMGVNGSGKTTLGEIIVGTKKAEGIIDIKIDLLRKNAVFQESSFYASLSLKRIADFFKEAFNSESNLDELFELFELSKYKKMKYRKLSGGQKQKFKFLIGLISNPNLLLLDELTTSLDYIWRQKIKFLIQNYIAKNDLTMLLISHDLNEVAALCNRVIFINEGIIVKDIKLGKNANKNEQILKKAVSENVNSY